jgi:hypothetical protein
MDKALNQSISSKPFLKGILVTDSNGLCIASKGELSEEKSGRFFSISKSINELSQISGDQNIIPSVLIETNERDILVKEYDSLTIVLSSDKDN